MPLGTEHALVGIVAVGALAISGLLGGLWWTVEGPGTPRTSAAIASPAPMDDPPFCEHRIEPEAQAAQVIVRVHPLAENPPPPPAGILVEASWGATVLQARTDIFGCASVIVPEKGSYVFVASVQESDGNVTHRWWSNDVTKRYGADPVAYLELRLNNYARYA